MLGTLKDIADFIKANDDFAVITHFKPDGDAYGSALGLVGVLRLMGKNAFPVCDDEVEPAYRFLENSAEFTNSEKGLPFTPLTAIGVDVSEASRMGKSEELFWSCPKQGVIDHHATNVGFGDVTYLEADAASTGELIVKLADELGVKLTKPIAEQLYTAISTDSGNFSFADTSPQTLMMAAKCLEAGADAEKLTRLLYRSRTPGKTRLIGLALSSFVMSPSGRVAGVKLTVKMFEEAGAALPEAHSLVNYMNEIQGVCVGILAEERPDATRVSFRGANGTDVSVLAQQFGGGGHIAASGARFEGENIDEVFKKVMDAAERFVCD
ncbi:MAG: bifunctional oligoribonuclease/PAP phosphatase NrnA [Clostridiales bacterium]|nr:bifunctional oligoribonuclease/PAP phosphatase NrnA [Clostridiales bacterium]